MLIRLTLGALLCVLLHRYTDEVRRVVKMCYEDMWALLQEHKPALMATVNALSEHGELLGGELRDLFDENPPEGVSCALFLIVLQSAYYCLCFLD